MRQIFEWEEGVDYKVIDEGRMKYQLIGDHIHYHPSGRTKTIPNGRKSDGATCARDLCPEAFFLHDEFCIDPFWDCGKPISNLGASLEYMWILKLYGFRFRSRVRLMATFLFGGGKIKRKCGWFRAWKR